MKLEEYKKLPLFDWNKHRFLAGEYRCNDPAQTTSQENAKDEKILGLIRKVIVEVTIRYDGHFVIKSYTEVMR